MRTRAWLGVVLVCTALLAACDTDGEGEGAAGTPSPQPDATRDGDERAAELEAEVAALESEVAALEGEMAALEQQLAEAREQAPGDRPQPALPHSVEGVEDALRAYFPSEPWHPGVTRWRQAEVELPGDLTDPGSGVAEHGELTLRLVDAVVDAEAFGGAADQDTGFPWEVTARVLRTGEDQAVAVVQQWGTGDDSVSGTDYRFALERAAGGWYVTGVAERDQCTRNGRLPGEDDLPELCV